MLVAEHLHLDMARGEERALDQEPPVAERVLGLRAGGGERRLEGFGLADDAHAAPSAAGGRLDHHRIADALRLRGEARRALVRRHGSRARTGRRRPPCCRFAALLSPMARIAAGGGPTKTRPAAPQASARSAFSARKP